MRKTGKRVEKAPVESEDSSPSKKTKLKEKNLAKDAAQAIPSGRLPRAAKNRVVEPTNNNVEGIIEPKKSRAKPKTTLRRSNSSGDIASTAGKLKKTKSKSAENLHEDEIPAKKGRNIGAKTAKKTVDKKAGNEAKAKPRGKAAKKNELEEMDEETQEDRPVLVAKKAYGRGIPKKVVQMEAKDPGKPELAEKTVPVKKAARGRGKPASTEGVQEDIAVETKPLKGKRGRAMGKKGSVAEEEEKEVGNDEEEAENVAEVEEDAEEAMKPKRGKKAGTGTMKTARGKKTVANVPSQEKDTETEDENQNVKVAQEAAADVSKGEARATKGNKKGKGPGPKNRGKKASPPVPKDDVPEKENGAADEDAEDEDANGAQDEPQGTPENDDDALDNEKENSAVEAGEDLR